MTKADAARLVAIVVTAYPNFDKFKDAKAIEATVNLWAMMFEQDESGIVALAVKKHIATNQMAAECGRSPGDHAGDPAPGTHRAGQGMAGRERPLVQRRTIQPREISPASSHLWWRGPLSQSAGFPSGKCTAAHT